MGAARASCRLGSPPSRRPSGLGNDDEPGDNLTDVFRERSIAVTFRPPEMAAREMGGLSLADALSLCELAF